MSAYRLRRREGAQIFAHAWDRIVVVPGLGKRAGPRTDWRKVTDPAVIERVEAGFVQPLFYAGKLTAIRRKPYNSALFRVLHHCDAIAGADDNRAAQA
ncbi:hypothetical protein [Pseudoblastomonas halimionae]|uniref:Uncharacterized protein n=1 Tax=Alteriqipengyuania halimionae TaxID=1926630 RepID=A0A6I4U3B9_9SPHN|nr:hypothetical protein [Alteriqipengyuania halimionae]MXP10510.1 hypothetical protein [Alteriqipengyuania halimionae]